MDAVTLYEPTQFEPLIDEPWAAARIEDAIAAIVADTDAAYDGDELWPAHDWEGYREGKPAKVLYAGAAGVLWALDELRHRGHRETSIDLAAAAFRALELERAEPAQAERLAGANGRRRYSLFTGDLGTALFAAACLDGDPRFPIIDVM